MVAGSRKPKKLSHLGPSGRPRMVDVGAKAATQREAVATGSIRVSREAMNLVRRGEAAKGNVVETARLAGVMAAKRTSELVPLCHPLPLEHVEVDIEDVGTGFDLRATARTTAKTGVEMEALTAVAVAALTVYDMLKAADRAMVIRDIRLLRKSGGRSGDWTRSEET
jgi:cyclic pyranopterin phosphate synthase